MRFDVFGREIEVVRRADAWLVFYPGAEGKKRLAEDIFIPAEVNEADLTGYLADLCHEWARPGHDAVLRL